MGSVRLNLRNRDEIAPTQAVRRKCHFHLRITAMEHFIAPRRIGLAIVLEDAGTVYLPHEEVVPFVPIKLHQPDIGFVPTDTVG